MSAILQSTLAILTVTGLMSTSTAMAPTAALKSGELNINDKADFFSLDAIKKARDDFALLQSANDRRVAILTLNALPDDAKEKFGKLSSDKEKHDFWLEFAKNLANGERGIDVFILICRSPGHVQVLADKTVRNMGFGQTEEDAIAKIIVKYFGEAKGKPAAEMTPLYDKALLEAVKELRKHMPITTPLRK